MRYVVEGSVRKEGGRVALAAQLNDVATGAHLWAERYDREIADVFAVQDEITENIVAALEAQAPARAPGDRRVVRHDDERQPLGAQRLEHGEDLVAHALVEVAGRLVGQQHARALDDRAGDRDALLLTARQLARPVVGAIGEADVRERLGDARRALGLRAARAARAPCRRSRRPSASGSG